jgi:hypothetical protein
MQAYERSCEGRRATALLLAECDNWPPGNHMLPDEESIGRKLHALWMQNEDWIEEFESLLSAACFEKQERLPSLLRYVRS